MFIVHKLIMFIYTVNLCSFLLNLLVILFSFNKLNISVKVNIFNIKINFYLCYSIIGT